MTPTPHGQVPEVPEALRLADWLDLYAPGDPSRREIEEAAVELRSLHAQVTALRTTHVQKPAEIEHVAGDVSKNGAEVNMNVYAELPQSVGDHKYGGGLYTDAQMLAFADATHALRTQQPAPATQQAASSAVLKAIREANMQLVRTGDDAFMLVPYKVATPQAADSVPAGPKRKDMLWSTAKLQERHDQRIENIVSGLERIKQEHAGQQPQKIDECYGDCPTDSTTCTNPCRFDGRAARATADSVLEDAARWEFRWLNPANKLNVAPSDLGWKTVNSKGMRSEKEVLEDLQAYRYQGKPVYEVRPLFATRALEKPEIRCPVRLANGGDCPRHNLQCGWPDCNKESK